MRFGLRATMVSGLLYRDPITGHSPGHSSVAVSKMEPSMVGRKGWLVVPRMAACPRLLEGGSNYDIGANASGMVTVGPDPIVGNLLNRVATKFTPRA